MKTPQQSIFDLIEYQYICSVGNTEDSLRAGGVQGLISMSVNKILTCACVLCTEYRMLGRFMVLLTRRRLSRIRSAATMSSCTCISPALYRPPCHQLRYRMLGTMYRGNTFTAVCPLSFSCSVQVEVGPSLALDAFELHKRYMASRRI